MCLWSEYKCRECLKAHYSSVSFVYVCHNISTSVCEGLQTRVELKRHSVCKIIDTE